MQDKREQFKFVLNKFKRCELCNAQYLGQHHVCKPKSCDIIQLEVRKERK